MQEENKKIIAKKIEMTQVWNGDVVIPVTVLLCDKKSEEYITHLVAGDVVSITGTSKGKGFQGVVKRHGFHGGPKTHGQKNRLRAPGSLGPTAPQRVLKGRKMAGHMGNVKVTIRNVHIVLVDVESKKILVKGAVPGMRGTRVEIKKKA
jgi:large subunit ribosomal protein L3